MDKKGFITTQFGEWLLPQIKTNLISSINLSKLFVWDEYFNNQDIIDKKYSAPIKTFDLLLFLINNLCCTGVDGEITICIPEALKVPYFNNTKATTIAKLINNGALDIKGYPLFTTTFNKFAQEIDFYVSLFYDL